MTQPQVRVEHFARVFVDDPGQLPPQADCYKSERGYFYRLNLQSVNDDAASALVKKARNQFQVELVGQVVEDGEIVKERRYVDDIDEVPDGYKPERGPQGGVYYETNPVNDPTDTASFSPGAATEIVGYGGQPVLAVQFGDVDEGDRIAFEQDDGERDMGKIISIDEDESEVVVQSGDGETRVAAAPLEGVEAKSEGGGDASLTSTTTGAHNAVYSEDDDEDEEDEIEKDEGDPGPWVYYVGPEGGEGWQSMSTGDIRYQVNRPGPGPEDPMVEGDLASGWEDFSGDHQNLIPGQRVEFEDLSGDSGFLEGIVQDTGEKDDGRSYVELEVPSHDVSGFLVGEGNDNSQITAVEEDPELAEDQLDREVGEEVHLRTDHLSEENPGYMDEEGEIGGFIAVNGELHYEVVDDNGTLIREFTEDELEDLEVDEDDKGWEEMMEDVTGEEVFNPEQGDEMLIEWPDAHEEGPFEAFYDEQQKQPGDNEPTVPGYRITEGVYDGVWVSAEDADSIEMLEDEDDGDSTDSEDASEGPDESVEDDAVAEPVGTPESEGSEEWDEKWTAGVVDSSFDTDSVDEWKKLSEYHFPSGVSAKFMRVGATDEYDGETNEGLVFGNFYGGYDEAGVPPASEYDENKENLGRRQMTTYEVANAIGGNVPTCVSPDDGDTVFTEGVEGENIGAAPAEYIEKVDEDEFYEQAAVQIICGNNDCHSQNVMVTPDGTPVFHDIDHSSGDVGGQFTGKKYGYDDAIDRTLGELWSSAQHVVSEGKVEAKKRMLQEAKEKAEEVHGTDTLNNALSDAQEFDEDFSGNISGNVHQLAEDKIDWQP